MTKLVCKWILFAVIAVGSVAVNNIVLLSWHPLEYYYTLPGMLLSGGFCLGKAIVLAPIMRIFIDDLLKETTSVLLTKEES